MDCFRRRRRSVKQPQCSPLVLVHREENDHRRSNLAGGSTRRGTQPHSDFVLAAQDLDTHAALQPGYFKRQIESQNPTRVNLKARKTTAKNTLRTVTILQRRYPSIRAGNATSQVFWRARWPMLFKHCRPISTSAWTWPLAPLFPATALRSSAIEAAERAAANTGRKHIRARRLRSSPSLQIRRRHRVSAGRRSSH